MFSVLDAKVPEHKRQAVSEFITRANYGIVAGNFEMDFSDGEVRYKTALYVKGMTIDTATIRNLVYPNAFTMDRYFNGLMRVIYSDITPEEAVAKCEAAKEHQREQVASTLGELLRNLQ
jgi:hypothetical protein